LYDNSAAGGGGIYTPASSVTLHNTLVAGSTGGDVHGTLASASSYNLIGDGSGGLTNGVNHNLLGTSTNPINPLLAPLGNYGRPTQTLALLPGSKAIGAGDPSESGSTDQHGVTRVSNVEIGAFQTQGFTIAVTNGNNQSASINAAFSNPLLVTVTAKNNEENTCWFSAGMPVSLNSSTARQEANAITARSSDGLQTRSKAQAK
jgi:hypothetical protein